MTLKTPPVGLAPLLAILLSGCATTTLTSAWKDPAYQGRPRKIMVIRLAKKALNKRVFEDEFVRQLKARGTDAVPGYSVLPDEKQADREFIAAKMKEQGADAVLISRLTSKKTVQTRVPGTVYLPPENYRRWRDYHGYGYQAVYTPGYTVEDEYALMETNLYDAANDGLIWSASSETAVQDTDQKQVSSYIGVMLDAMAGQKLLR